MAQVEGTAAKSPELSVGSVRRLAAAALRPEEAAGGPIRVQVLCRKPAREGSKDRRTALRISDSCHHILALLAEDIKDPQEGSVIELLEWSCGMHEGLQAVFVEDWDQTSTECLGILGQPVGVPLEAPQTSAPQTSAFEAPIAPAAKRQPLCEKPRPVASPMRSQGQASFHRDTQSLASPHAVAAMMPASASLPVVPIAQLSSFMQRCRVMVRVMSKSEMKTFSNARGPGKLFSVDLMDAAGECVRAACFNSAADKYFGMLQIKKTYDINGASVKPGNPRWCRYPFELTIEDRGTSVVALPEDGSIPPMPYKFVPLASLGTSPAGSSCDVMGVVHSVEEPVSIATRNQGPRQRRQFLIVDNSKASVSVSLWGEKADIQFGVGSVIFIRNAKVSDFSGRSLDLNAGSFLEANPDDKRAFQLKAAWAWELFCVFEGAACHCMILVFVGSCSQLQAWVPRRRQERASAIHADDRPVLGQRPQEKPCGDAAGRRTATPAERRKREGPHGPLPPSLARDGYSGSKRTCSFLLGLHAGSDGNGLEASNMQQEG